MIPDIVRLKRHTHWDSHDFVRYVQREVTRCSTAATSVGGIGIVLGHANFVKDGEYHSNFSFVLLDGAIRVVFMSSPQTTTI